MEKAYDRVDRENWWKVLQMYGGGLLNAIKSFYVLCGTGGVVAPPPRDVAILPQHSVNFFLPFFVTNSLRF